MRSISDIIDTVMNKTISQGDRWYNSGYFTYFIIIAFLILVFIFWPR